MHHPRPAAQAATEEHHADGALLRRVPEDALHGEAGGAGHGARGQAVQALRGGDGGVGGPFAPGRGIGAQGSHDGEGVGGGVQGGEEGGGGGGVRRWGWRWDDG